MTGLRPDFGGGRPPKLDGGERERLANRLAADGPWTTAEIRDLIADEFGVDYSPGYLPRLVRSLGMSYRNADAVSDGDVPDVGGVTDGRTPLVGFFGDDRD